MTPPLVLGSDNGTWNHILPTAIATKAVPLFLLCFLYFSVGALAAVEFVRSLCNGSFKVASFKGVFLLLAFAVCVVRFILTLVPFYTWNLFSITLIGVLFPEFLQLITFSLLIIFFGQMLVSHFRKREICQDLIVPSLHDTCCSTLYCKHFIQPL